MALKTLIANIKGPKGDPGQGLPDGGTTGQILAKKTEVDKDVEWIDAPTGVTKGSKTYDNYYSGYNSLVKYVSGQVCLALYNGEPIPVTTRYFESDGSGEGYSSESGQYNTLFWCVLGESIKGTVTYILF